MKIPYVLGLLTWVIVLAAILSLAIIARRSQSYEVVKAYERGRFTVFYECKTQQVSIEGSAVMECQVGELQTHSNAPSKDPDQGATDGPRPQKNRVERL